MVTKVSTSAVKVNSAQQSEQALYFQKIQNSVKSFVDQYFSSTLKTEPNIVDLYMAQMYRESSFVSGSRGQLGSLDPASTVAGKFIIHPKITNLPTKQQKLNMIECASAIGLSQSMGFNHVRGVDPSNKSSRCEIERLVAKGLDSSLLNRLLINPGDSISSILGMPSVSIKSQCDSDYSIVENQILAGLVILHGKWTDNVKESGGRFYNKGASAGLSSIPYQRRIEAAMAAYIGLGKQDVLGTDGYKYVMSILSVDIKNKLGVSPMGPSDVAGVSMSLLPIQKPVGCG